jgi:hypothetical protein
MAACRSESSGLAAVLLPALLVLLTLAILPSRGAVASQQDTIVQVEFPDLQTLDQFLDRHPDTQVRTERRIVRPELRVSAAGLAELQRRGYPLRIVRAGLDAGADSLTSLQARNQIDTSLYTFQAHQDSLAALMTRYPNVTRMITIGHSLLNRPIHAFEVSDNPQVHEDEPVLLLVATIHSNEGVGTDVTHAFLRTLLAGYGVDAAATSMVDNSEIWVVPLLNPDGWMLLESGTLRDWRENCADNNGDGVFEGSADGVDLNRNFSIHWEIGTDTLSTLPTYRGPFPFSEPETSVLRDLMLEIRPTMVLSYHQHGDVVIIPWLFNGHATPDSMTYRALASRIAAATTNSAGGPFGWYEDARTAGFLEEWVYGVQGGFCFTVEVTTDSPSAIDEAVNRTQGGIYQAWSELNGPQITGHVLSSRTGEPIEAEIQVLEIDTPQLEPRHSDPATGRYRRLLVPGSYTLSVRAPGYFPTTRAVQVEAGPTPTEIYLADSAFTTAVEPGRRAAPRLTSYPNPAHGRVRVGFDPGPAGPVRLELHDLSGRRVRTLLDGIAAAGWNQVDWKGDDDSGRPLPTGVYLLRISRGSRIELRRIVWIR